MRSRQLRPPQDGQQSLEDALKELRDDATETYASLIWRIIDFHADSQQSCDTIR